MAQLVLGLAGAYIGSNFGPGGAQVGFAIGSALGGAYDASRKRIVGPRPTDLRFPGADYGEPIPWLLANPRITGQYWWLSEKRIVDTTTEAGKGSGPSVTTSTTECDMFIGLSDLEPGETIIDVSRVWSNGKLVRNRLTGASVETLATVFREDIWRRMTVYNGAAGQLPDPVMEAALGVGNAPGYRGRSGVFIEGLQGDSNGQFPVLSFEVMTSGTSDIEDPTLSGVAIDRPASFTAGTIAIDEQTHYVASIGQWDGGFASSVVYCYQITVQGESNFTGQFSVASPSVTATGNSDVPLFVQREAVSTEFVTYTVPDGVSVTFVTGDNLGGAELRFCRSGQWLIAGSSTTGTKKLYRFFSENGTASGSSLALATYVSSIIIVGDYVYACALGAASVYKLGLGSMSLQATITRPSSNHGLLVNLNGQLALVASTGGTSRFVWTLNTDGTTWTLLSGVITDATFVPNADVCQSIGVVGALLVSGLNIQDGDDQYKTWTAPITLSPAGISLQLAVEKMCARSGMPAGTYDASALASITRQVRGMAITGGVLGAMQQLMAAYGFTCALSDKLYFFPLGAASVGTIAYDDLGAGREEASRDPLSIVVASDIENPPQIIVHYKNAANDNQVGTEYSDRLTMSTQVSAQAVEWGLSMLPAEAKGAADRLVADAAAAISSAQVSLTLAHAAKEPGDSFHAVTADGDAIRLRIERRSDDGAVLTLQCVLDEPTAVDSEELTDDDYDEQTEVNSISAALWQTLDMPQLRDADNGPGWYATAKGTTRTYAGAQILGAADSVNFALLATVAESAVFGTCTTTLGDFAGGSATMDEVNTLTVNVGNGELASSTRDAMLDDNTINALYLSNGEVLRFVVAALQSASPNIYTVSRLLRGQLGTESFIDTHETGEACTLLRPQGLRRIATQAAALNIATYIKAVSLGTSPADVTARIFTNTGLSLKPYAPAHVRALADAAGLVTVTWERRSRFAYRWPSTSELPLGEDSESYEIDLLSAEVAGADAWNPADKDADITLSGSDRIASITAANGCARIVTGRDASDDVYCELTMTGPDGLSMPGIGQITAGLSGYPGDGAISFGYWGSNGYKYSNGSGNPFGATFASGDVIGLRMKQGALIWSKNGVSQGVAETGLTGTWYVMWAPASGAAGTRSADINLGQDPFGALPAGSRAWGADPATAISTFVSTTPSVQLSAAALAVTLPVAATPVALISGTYYGVDVEGNIGSPTVLRRLVAQTEMGIVAQSPYIGQALIDAVFTATDAYTAAYFTTAGTPSFYSTTAIHRFALSDITAPAATYTAAVAGDIKGIAHDGADLWVLEADTPRLRRLNGTTLAVSATHALGGPIGGPACLAWHGGDLFFVDSDDLVSLDSTGITENWRTALDTSYGPLGGSIFGIVVADGNVFVSATIGVYVYSEATGTLVATTGLIASAAVSLQSLFVHGADVALWAGPASTQPYVILDGATGAVVQRFSVPSGASGLLGADGTNVWVGGVQASSTGYDVMYGYTPVGASLSGYKARVYQMSATYGRGYPATATIA